jgi:endonuclease-8
VPEGDSIRRIAVRMQVLVGERVAAESPHPRGLATGVARAVDGRVLEAVESVGKNLVLRFEGGVVLRSHLRMSGRWRVQPVGSRRAGRPWLVLRAGGWEAIQWNGPVLTLGSGGLHELGPDLLAGEATVDDLVERIRRADRARAVAEVLVDQRVVAGIGNMWVAEALWHARVAPATPVADVSDDGLRDALTWARREMRAAVDGARPACAVYRRAGRGCPRCGTPISSRGLGDANRRAYWCATCQPES